jgi:hypothetical protein
MIDLVLRLIDRLIDLSKRQEQVDRALFTDFVAPAFEAFERVHTDYIKSLVRYQSRLSDPAYPIDLTHPIFDDMKLDSLKTQHLRTKLSDFHPESGSLQIEDAPQRDLLLSERH